MVLYTYEGLEVIPLEINKRNLTFSPSENKELEDIIEKNSTVLRIPQKKIFMYPGESLNHIYYIKDGRTRHYMADHNGNEKILYVLTKGWFFGEAAFVLDYAETSLYSKAETDSTLYLIDRTKAMDLLDNNSLFREAIMRCFAFKTMILRYEIENIIFNPAKDRIKRFLCVNISHDSVDNYNWIDINSEYTHYEIGVLIGCTRVTVSKMINELIKEGFIRVVNNKIQVNKKKYYDYINQQD